MLGYNYALSMRALKKDAWVTTLVVVTLGLGICASMTMLSVIHAMSADPLPGRSGELFYPHLDASPPGFAEEIEMDPSADLTWTDATNLLRAHKAEKQAIMAGGRANAQVPQRNGTRTKVRGRYVSAEFFSMFQVPFRAGAGWTSIEDERRQRIVVLSHSLAIRLFGDTTAVGKRITLDDVSFSVAGVLDDWMPQPLFYGSSAQGMFGQADEFFVPLTTALDAHLKISGNMVCWGEGSRTGDQCAWLQFWVRVARAQRPEYEAFLRQYALEQAAGGRNIRILPSALLGVKQRMAQLEYIPSSTTLRLWLALAFFAVCIVNSCGLLLAKSTSQTREIALRRALGARKRQIFAQVSVEAAMAGTIAGGFGLVATWALIWLIRHGSSKHAHLVQMDIMTVATTVAVSVIAALLAGLLPAWHASNVAPASRLKG